MSANHVHSHQKELNYNLYFFIGIFLNITFVITEVVIGLYIGSLALVADAGHNLTDVFSLILAGSAHYLSRKSSSERKTYGFKKFTILASLLSSVLLLIALGGILWEAIHRFSQPVQIQGFHVMVVASIGVVINGFTAYLFMSGQKEDLNIRGAYLHMLADTGVSMIVVLGGISIWLFGWTWIDPLLTVGIAISIFLVSWSLLKDSLALSLDFVPTQTDISGIKNYLTGLENVTEIHDLHVWGISTRETALTVHLVMNKINSNNRFLNEIQEYLHEHFHIQHSTIQLETQNGHTDYDPKCN